MNLNHHKTAVCIEVERLASRLLDGQQDEQSLARLEELLAQDAVARDCFIDCVALHTLLGARHEAELDSSATMISSTWRGKLLGEERNRPTIVARPSVLNSVPIAFSKQVSGTTGSLGPLPFACFAFLEWGGTS